MSEKWILVAEKVIELTNSGQLTWKETPSIQSFQTKVGTQIIEISEEPIGNRHNYEFKIFDKNGNIVDAFTDTDLANVPTYSNWEYRLQQMFRLIRRRLSGAEDALDALIKELDKKSDEIPF